MEKKGIVHFFTGIFGSSRPKEHEITRVDKQASEVVTEDLSEIFNRYYAAAASHNQRAPRQDICHESSPEGEAKKFSRL